MSMAFAPKGAGVLFELLDGVCLGAGLASNFCIVSRELTYTMSESLAVKHSGAEAAKSSADDVVRVFSQSVENGERSNQPYPHWVLRACFAAENQQAFPVCAAVAQAFQDKRVTSQIEKVFGTDLAGTYLRMEFAQDIDGFWLEPHSDLGVKLFTMLLYLSTDDSHSDLGTDIYDADKKHVGRSPFASNAAMIFVPADNTFHGFEKRPIKGVRVSLIINYVTDEWRAREQLAFPETPIA